MCLFEAEGSIAPRVRHSGDLATLQQQFDDICARIADDMFLPSMGWEFTDWGFGMVRRSYTFRSHQQVGEEQCRYRVVVVCDLYCMHYCTLQWVDSTKKRRPPIDSRVPSISAKFPLYLQDHWMFLALKPAVAATNISQREYQAICLTSPWSRTDILCRQ